MLKILQPAELCGLHLKNRLFRSATWLALCRPDGTPTPELYQHYRQLAQGGIGTIITELTDVCERNNAIGNNMRLYTDALIPAYQQLVAIAHASGAAIIPQLNMYQYVRPGTGQQTLDVNALTPEDLAEIRQLYIAAAVRAKQCGFDAVQLHLAYGWLLYRFLNPYYNQRQDAYGATPENRCRLIVEIIQGIKAQLPDYPICAKFSFYFKPQAEIRRILAQHKDQPLPIAPCYAADECAGLCQHLYAGGLDFIEVLGDHAPWENGNRHPSCYQDLAKAVRAKCPIPIVLTGCNNEPQQLEQLLDQDKIDAFALSRALIREPQLPNRWMSGDLSPAKCIHCDACYQTKAHQCRFQ